jgi:hypothetical protein
MNHSSENAASGTPPPLVPRQQQVAGQAEPGLDGAAAARHRFPSLDFLLREHCSTRLMPPYPFSLRADG